MEPLLSEAQVAHLDLRLALIKSQLAELRPRKRAAYLAYEQLREEEKTLEFEHYRLESVVAFALGDLHRAERAAMSAQLMLAPLGARAESAKDAQREPGAPAS